MKATCNFKPEMNVPVLNSKVIDLNRTMVFFVSSFLGKRRTNQTQQVQIDR